jgi:hypothetical protein
MNEPPSARATPTSAIYGLDHNRCGLASNQVIVVTRPLGDDSQRVTH